MVLTDVVDRDGRLPSAASPDPGWCSAPDGRAAARLRLVPAQRRVVRLGPAAQDAGEGMPRGAQVPRADPAALVELHVDDLARRVASRTSSRPSRSRSASLLAVSDPSAASADVLGGDEVRQRRGAHVGDVDAAEQAVPVAVVGLAAVEVVAGRLARATPAGIAVDERRGPEHLLVEVVDLAVADLEVPPEAAPQPARLRGVRRRGLDARHRRRPRLSDGGSAHSPISAYEPVGR